MLASTENNVSVSMVSFSVSLKAVVCNVLPFQTPDGVTNATERLLTILKVAAGLVPMATALYLSNLTRCTVPPDIDQPSFD